MTNFKKKTQEDFLEKAPTGGRSKSKNLSQLSKNEKRFALRNKLKEHNKKLASEAKKAGIKSPRGYAGFQNAGYKGLYNGLNATDIALKKGLGKGENILDHMGVMELAANLFTATQTEHKLKKENITDKKKAAEIHHGVGIKVRQMIFEIGGTMPEDMSAEPPVK